MTVGALCAHPAPLRRNLSDIGIFLDGRVPAIMTLESVTEDEELHQVDHNNVCARERYARQGYSVAWY